MGHSISPFTVRQTDEFGAWLRAIKDGPAQRRLLLRLRKAMLGNLGDVKSVGDGVYEMREFFGNGWRMYYVRRGRTLIVMLGGGDKTTQDRDIVAAKRLAGTLED